MQNKQTEQTNLTVVLAIVVLATLTRITGPSFGNNFAPMNAISIFSGAYFGTALLAVGVPLLSVVIGDYAVNYLYAGDFSPLYPGWYWQYIAYVGLACIGILLRGRVKPLSTLGASLGGSIFFFVVSNIGVWLSAGLYPRTLDGLAACFAMAVPFFRGTVTGDLFFVALMFGACELLRRRVSSPSRERVVLA